MRNISKYISKMRKNRHYNDNILIETKEWIFAHKTLTSSYIAYLKTIPLIR